jgi:hypothetical protein
MHELGVEIVVRKSGGAVNLGSGTLPGECNNQVHLRSIFRGHIGDNPRAQDALQISTISLESNDGFSSWAA